MPLSLYLLRHGQTSFSKEDSFCGSGLDPELTPEGLEMAQAFAETYRSLSWKAIYASPLKRTVATADPLCKMLGMNPELRDGLQEIAYGRWEGRSKEEVSRDFHDDYIRWLSDPAWNPPTEGETALMIARRALQAVEEITGLASEKEEARVLVVSHKATIRILLCSLMGIDVGRFRSRLACPVGSVSVVEFTEHGPLLQSLADRAHLNERLRRLPGT